MKLDKRLKKLEGRIKDDRFIPVLFVDHEDEIEQYRDQIGENTIVFIDDYGDEYDAV